MTAREIDKIVCNWSMETGTAMSSEALNTIVDTLSERTNKAILEAVKEERALVDEAVEIISQIDHEEGCRLKYGRTKCKCLVSERDAFLKKAKREEEQER